MPNEQFFRTSDNTMRWWWCPLCTKPTLISWILIVPAHWNNSPRVDTPLHSYTLSWCRAYKSLFLFLNAVCLAAKQHIKSFLSLDWPDRGYDLHQPHPRWYANHYTTDAVFTCIKPCYDYTTLITWSYFPKSIVVITQHELQYYVLDMSQYKT